MNTNAFKNIDCMSVTDDVFQFPMFSLNTDALKNICRMFVTDAVFQLPMS